MTKYYCLLLLTFLFTCTACNAQTQPSKIPAKSVQAVKQRTPEEKLARLIFQSLQTNNDVLWASLFPANEEYRQLLQLMLDNKMAGITAEKIEGMIAEREREATGAYAADFKRLVKQADSSAIRWPKAVYKDFLFQPYVKNNFPRKYLNGDIWCMFGKTEFVIEGIEAVETPAGFRLQSVQGIRRIDDSY